MSTENAKTWKILGIIGLVVGIIGLILSLFGALGFYLGILGILLSIGSIALAAKQQGKYVLAAIALILSIVATYFGYNMKVAYEKAATEMLNGFSDELKNINLEDLNK